MGAAAAAGAREEPESSRARLMTICIDSAPSDRIMNSERRDYSVNLRHHNSARTAAPSAEKSAKPSQRKIMPNHRFDPLSGGSGYKATVRLQCCRSAGSIRLFSQGLTDGMHW